jgi:YHS domain-containing protein
LEIRQCIAILQAQTQNILLNFLLMKPVLFIGLIFMALLACSQQEEKTVEIPVAPENASKYTPAMVVNEKDYACGMPVTAGISDTCHYEDKAYGFCSPECKDIFLKDPKKYLAIK